MYIIIWTNTVLVTVPEYQNILYSIYYNDTVINASDYIYTKKILFKNVWD